MRPVQCRAFFLQRFSPIVIFPVMRYNKWVLYYYGERVFQCASNTAIR
jgi:hypothetical protein